MRQKIILLSEIGNIYGGTKPEDRVLLGHLIGNTSGFHKSRKKQITDLAEVHNCILRVSDEVPEFSEVGE